MAKNILICDDDSFRRRIMKDILTKNGYNVIAEVSDGAKAVKLYKETSPDLVLMDIVMPIMDGINALKKIMSMDPNAKVVMCSSMGQHLMVVEAIQAGAKDFVLKPYKPERLLKAVERVIG